ncbi:MAG: adenosylcobinamide amidohydrolase [Methanobacteriaceae archaeon]|nr:adenosylcobinamide amidohydrolase [Methanobacteriaceae archaeon]
MKQIKELIYKIDENKKVYKTENSLVVQLENSHNGISTSWHNGGYQSEFYNVINQTLAEDDFEKLINISYEDFIKREIQKHNLDVNTSTMLITTACMDNYSIVTKKYEDLEVTAIVTAGADKNAVQAGDPSTFYEKNNNYKLTSGTINIIILINAKLSPGTLQVAGITTTEAKTKVLRDLKIQSNFSKGLATGTGTDGICILSDNTSENKLENAGKHSKLGELIAKTTIEATIKALSNETNQSIEYQKTVLSRLERFNITFDTFYKKTKDITLLEFSEKFYYFNKDPVNISWISSVLNLIDESNTKLMDIKTVCKVSQDIIQLYCNKNSLKIETIDELLEYLIISIIKKVIEN